MGAGRFTSVPEPLGVIDEDTTMRAFEGDEEDGA
jgi:hypothetical protein